MGKYVLEILSAPLESNYSIIYVHQTEISFQNLTLTQLIYYFINNCIAVKQNKTTLQNKKIVFNNKIFTIQPTYGKQSVLHP